MKTVSLVCLLLGAAGFILTAVARCDQRTPHTRGWTEQDALLLSRVAVSESGWSSAHDHSAIYLVLKEVQRRLRLTTLSEAAQAYSPRATGVREADGRFRWIAQLGQTWPAELHGRYRDRWLVVLERSRMMLDGRFRRWCVRDPHHWGAPELERPDLEPVDCGHTRNVFYRRGT